MLEIVANTPAFTEGLGTRHLQLAECIAVQAACFGRFLTDTDMT